MSSKLKVSLNELSYLPIITKVELPLRQRILSYFSSINLHILDLIPKRMTQHLLKPQLHHKFRKASLFLIEIGQECLDAGSAARLIESSHPVVVFDTQVTSIPQQRVNSLVVLVRDCNHQSRIPPFVPFVDVRTPQHQHLNKRKVVSHRCQLQTVVSVFLINCPIDGKSTVQQSHHFLQVVGGNGSQHAVAARVRENGGVFAVPCDLVVEVRGMIEQEGVWGIPRKTGPPFIEIERQPLGRAEDCLGRNYVVVACSSEIKHENNNFGIFSRINDF